MELKDPVRREQAVYAAWLAAGSHIGLGLLVVTFLAYILDVWEPHVPIEHLPELWTLPADEFRRAIGGPHGWEWLALLHRGDFLTYLGVAALGLTTIACYLRVVPALAGQGDRMYAAIGVLQLVVLALAASGLVSGH
jgi:hypothetical protein